MNNYKAGQVSRRMGRPPGEANMDRKLTFQQLRVTAAPLINAMADIAMITPDFIAELDRVRLRGEPTFDELRQGLMRLYTLAQHMERKP